jgi:outer membrane protein assembly factor BamB
MKRFTSLTIAFLLCFALLLSVNASSGMDPNPADPTGSDPWLTAYYNGKMSGMSHTKLGEEFEESPDWPWDSDAGSNQMLGDGSVVYDGILFTQFNSDTRGSSSEVVAVELESGEEIWRTEVDGRLAFGAPAIDDGLGYIIVAASGGYSPKGGGSETYVSALTLEDGEIEWTSSVEGAVSCPLSVNDGAVYFKVIFVIDVSDDDVDYDRTGDDSRVIKIDAESGDVEWESDIEGAWYLEWDAPCVVVGDYVYAATCNFGLDSTKGSIYFLDPARLYCLDVDSGDIIWDIKDSMSRLGTGICSDGEYVYFARTRVDSSTNAAALVVTAHDLDSGSEEWEYSENGALTWWNVPVCNEDSVFIQSREGKIYAIEKDDGSKEWSKSVGNMMYGSALAVTKYYVVAAGWDIDNKGQFEETSLAVFDASRRGKQVWKESTNERIKHVAIYNRRLIFTGDTEIYCFESLAPELTIDPERIVMDKVERNTITEVELALENTGLKGLEGTVKVDQNWLSIDIEKVDDDTKKAFLTINTWDLDQGDYSGRVIFDTNGGQVLLPVLITVVDEEPPVIEWDLSEFIELDEKLYTKEKELTLKGKTEPTAFVFINGEEAELDADGYFEFFMELDEGKNEILVETEDDVGNKGEETLEIYLDTKPPYLIITTPDYTITSEERFYIIGQCDEEGVVVTIDDKKIELGKGGKFAFEVTLEKDVNTFVIKAVDKIGNENIVELHIVYPDKKIVILRIGNNQAEVNGLLIQLDAPPTIINGRTMVPLRFVSETFGAEVGWDGTEQKITLIFYGKTVELWIGRSTAIINGDPMVLDASPTIINGRTMVPLRFCAETFGAEVGWDGATQTITLIYPKP